MTALRPDLIRQAIANLYLQFPELETDEQLRADTIEGETDALEYISKLLRERGEAIAFDRALRQHSYELLERAAMFKRRAEARESLIASILNAAKLRKAQRPEGTAYFSAGKPKVIVTDEKLIPEAYIKTERSPRKAEIAEAIKGGAAIPGAELSNAEEVLVIRVK